MGGGGGGGGRGELQSSLSVFENCFPVESHRVTAVKPLCGVGCVCVFNLTLVGVGPGPGGLLTSV